MKCIGCGKLSHYCISCGYYEDSEHDACGDCWKYSGAKAIYDSATRDPDTWETTDETKAEIRAALDRYRIGGAEAGQSVNPEGDE